MYTVFTLQRILVPILFILPLSAFSQEEQPFWRQKLKLFTQIKKERRIVVSVKEENLQGQKKFRMSGVGAVRAPASFCVTKVAKFEKLPEVSGHFKKVVHKPEKKQVFLVIAALGYEARLLMEYKWAPKKGSKQQMDWQIIWGPFKGMVGNFQFEELSMEQTEISLWSSFSSHNIPIPNFLMKFTLEVIAEKVAKKMRSYIEHNYRENNEQSTKRPS